MTQSLYLDRSAAHLFKRCVQCPNESPSCPNCASDEVCTTTIGDCYSCSSAKCVKTALSGSTNASNNLGTAGPNVPAIAGGVAAGIVAIIVVAFCIWKYGLKGKRTKLPPEAYWDEDLPEEKPTSAKFGQLRDARSSTHTVQSLASTVLTRASNVIQIAYIPGVTQRDHLAPPVPPVPIPTGGESNHYSIDQRFFVPQLRDSQWSDNTSMMSGDIRKSVASSLARSSIGTMIYQDNALANPMPAMPVRGVNVISVKSASSTSTTPMDSPASQSSEFGMAHKASMASSAASRPVIVKMLGGSDASRVRAINGGAGMPAVGTAQAMKPISLNILKKGTTTPSQSSIDGAFAASSPATTLVNTPDRLTMRPRTANHDPHNNNARLSIADSIDTTAPHARARLSIAHSHRSIGDESSDEDDEDGHLRSRQSLLAGREQGPFGDDAAVRTPTKEEKRRSPFGDDNAL